MRHLRGFTLMELMVTLLVASILLGIGVPAFGNLIEQSRLVAASNRFLTALHLTRSEAIGRGHLVTICTSTDLASCSSGPNWDQGWILFSNPGRSDQPPDPDSILQVGNQGIHSSVAIIGNLPVSKRVNYNGLGHSERLSGALLMGTVTLCAHGDEGRAIVISSSGRPRVETTSCP